MPSCPEHKSSPVYIMKMRRVLYVEKELVSATARTSAAMDSSIQ